MELTKVLLINYLPYAKGVIVDRALPSIDGLKPSQRRILYTMFTMKLLRGDKTKSTNIVGATMRLHPHGDASIYDTMVRMSTGNQSLNVPYIESKGNFGKVYSKDLAYAASRYTEAKLAPICEEIFDGIDEDAVDFISNYDNSAVEPTLFPVKFPSILTNPSNGIAVGTGSRIPSFALKNVCSAVIGLCDGTINNITDLVNTLGIPEFTTGGYIHTTREDMINLATSGRGTITMTGRAITYSDHIEITEIPYSTKVENIIDAINDGIKDGTLKEISEIRDDTDLKNGLKLTVQLRRGANANAVLKKLIYSTPFCSTISFNTRAIIADKCETLGLMDLLKTWIAFRLETIRRVYNYRYNKASAKAHILETWDKIKDNLDKVAVIIRSEDEEAAKQALETEFGLSDAQCDYILDLKIRNLTKNNVKKHLKELEDTIEFARYCKLVVDDDNEKRKIIIEDQKRIIGKYGVPNKTNIAAPIDPDDKKKPEVKIDDDPVVVVVTKNYNIKRLVSIKDIGGYEAPENEVIEHRIPTRNNDHILVFTYDGTVHKILVNDIDATRGKMKDNIPSMLGINSKDIMLIDNAGDYSKHFNVVYKNGRGYRVNYSNASGKRAKYKNMFDGANPNEIWWTFSDQFFLVTLRRKAAYCDLKMLGMYSTRAAFKVARIDSGDSIFGLHDIKDVPDMNNIDLAKYNKDYTVSIGEDELWAGARENYLKRIQAKIEAKERAKAEAKAAKEKARAEAKAAKALKRSKKST